MKNKKNKIEENTYPPLFIDYFIEMVLSSIFVKKSNAMIFKWRHQLHFDVLNTNIDAHDELNIVCDGEKIPFVKKFRLLGVILDEYLSFDLHTIELCQKVNWKISVLKRSSYLFELKFRIILFKLFIMSKYDYCSSLFFYFADSCNQERLDKNFIKSMKSYLNIKLSELNVDEQFNHLKSFNILPLQLRFFQNVVLFYFLDLQVVLLQFLLAFYLI